MAKSKKEEILARVARDEVMKEIGHWFGRFTHGFCAVVTVEDADSLIELIKLRDEFSQDGGQPEIPAACAVECEVVEEWRPRSFVGMGM